jgi:predicted small metal-binding protein
MEKLLTCPYCGLEISAKTEEDIIKQEEEHGKKLGHPELTDDKIKQIKELIRKAE